MSSPLSKISVGDNARSFFADNYVRSLASSVTCRQWEWKESRRHATLGVPDVSNGKPKWMRWPTFDRLIAEHDAFVGQSLAGIAVLQQVLETPTRRGGENGGISMKLCA
jgi:hypothetical protein